jgi:hypothetical protein
MNRQGHFDAGKGEKVELHVPAADHNQNQSDVTAF